MIGNDGILNGIRDRLREPETDDDEDVPAAEWHMVISPIISAVIISGDSQGRCLSRDLSLSPARRVGGGGGGRERG